MPGSSKVDFLIYDMLDCHYPGTMVEASISMTVLVGLEGQLSRYMLSHPGPAFGSALGLNVLINVGVKDDMVHARFTRKLKATICNSRRENGWIV